MKIDACLISSPDRKWNSINKRIIKTKLDLNKKQSLIITMDSGGVKKSKEDWLPGRMMDN